MALQPKRVKWRKSQRGRIKGVASRGNTVVYGDFGLQSTQTGWITARQLEAARVACSHFLGSQGRYFVRVFPHKSVTETAEETRMGKGKGEPSFWVAVVRPGTVIYEVGGVPEEAAKEALARIAHKLPVRTRLARRQARV